MSTPWRTLGRSNGYAAILVSVLPPVLVRLYDFVVLYKSFYIKSFDDLTRMGKACEEHERREN